MSHLPFTFSCGGAASASQCPLTYRSAGALSERCIVELAAETITLSAKTALHFSYDGAVPAQKVGSPKNC